MVLTDNTNVKEIYLIRQMRHHFILNILLLFNEY